MNNLYSPSLKLPGKKREAARVTRQWEKRAATPAQRLLGHGGTTMETRERIGQALADHDPVTLKKSIEAQLREVHRQIRADQGEDPDPSVTGP